MTNLEALRLFQTAGGHARSVQRLADLLAGAFARGEQVDAGDVELVRDYARDIEQAAGAVLAATSEEVQR
jgi:hypothetical protein